MTSGADLCLIEPWFIVEYKGTEADARKASMTRRIHEDVLLGELQRGDMAKRVVRRTTDLLQVPMHHPL